MAHSTAARQQLFNALAEPTRLNIIELLASHSELSATDISNKFTVSPPAISQHLKVLREANFVQVEKRAQQRIYKINPAAMSEIEGWIKEMTKSWDARYNTLEKILRAEKRKTPAAVKSRPTHRKRSGSPD
ncbi:MAG TPA: metalloregulator ArsR/SmtB family transcription factor [Candidatus Bathyarchaeia archaeon]|nr:metalloregulator ArsR/SmtB family transcription factor [Candidatus Bathyarchaeia archaeon]